MKNINLEPQKKPLVKMYQDVKIRYECLNYFLGENYKQFTQYFKLHESKTKSEQFSHFLQIILSSMDKTICCEFKHKTNPRLGLENDIIDEKLEEIPGINSFRILKLAFDYVDHMKDKLKNSREKYTPFENAEFIKKTTVFLRDKKIINSPSQEEAFDKLNKKYYKYESLHDSNISFKEIQFIKDFYDYITNHKCELSYDTIFYFFMTQMSLEETKTKLESALTNQGIDINKLDPLIEYTPEIGAIHLYTEDGEEINYNDLS